jgi:hypothetical protein
MRKLSWVVCGVVVALVASACVGGGPPVKTPAPPPPPPSPHRDVVVFGDSNAWGIGCSLGDPGEFAPNPPFPCTPQPFSVDNETAGACTIAGATTLLYNQTVLNPSCFDWASRWPAVLAERTPNLVILNTGGWEIVDRWLNFPSGPGCSAANAFNCPAPDYQWGGANFSTAANRYTSQLVGAVNLFLSHGAEVLVVNSPYYAPIEPQVPGIADVWYEAYPAAQPANWNAANANITYRSSKVKTEQFNTTLKNALDQNFSGDPDVQFFDLWEHLSPVDPGTGAPAFNDFLCFPPNEKQWPDTFCPGNALRARSSFDHGHIDHDGYRFVVMPYLLPVIQGMLS